MKFIVPGTQVEMAIDLTDNVFRLVDVNGQVVEAPATGREQTLGIKSGGYLEIYPASATIACHVEMFLENRQMAILEVRRDDGKPHLTRFQQVA